MAGLEGGTPGRVLDVAGLGVRYGRQWAVQGVDLRAERGLILGLVGPDGAGKTTLLRAICGLQPVAAGAGTVLGLDLLRQPAQIRRRVGYIPQRFSLYGELTVQQNLDFFARIFGMDRAEAQTRSRWLLGFAGLEKFRRRAAGLLSGGMKQKLSLACGLIHQPELLLLDEPTNGVDPVARADLWQLLQQVRGQGTAVVVSTSYLDECAYMDEVGVLAQGRLLALGSPAHLADLAAGVGGAAGGVNGSAPPGAIWLEAKVASAEERLTALAALRRVPGVRRAVARGQRVIVALDANVDRCPDAGVRRSVAGIRLPVPLARHVPDMEDVYGWLTGWSGAEHGAVAAAAPTLVAAARADAMVGAGAVGSSDSPLAWRQLGSEPAVQVEGLGKQFGVFPALAGVNLQIQPGEIFGLLGPNGAGKTTLIRILCGLAMPTAGRVKVLGYEMPRQAHEARQRVGYMSQSFSLYLDLTVRENLLFYGRVYGMEGPALVQSVNDALASLGLERIQHQAAGDIGTGWRQRLGFACATLHRPQLLFLDEPTSGADPTARALFWERLYALAAQGTTILVTTHYMSEAEHCDRLALLSSGRLLALGTPAELMQRGGQASLMDVFLAVTRKGSPAEGAAEGGTVVHGNERE